MTGPRLTSETEASGTVLQSRRSSSRRAQEAGSRLATAGKIRANDETPAEARGLRQGVFTWKVGGTTQGFGGKGRNPWCSDKVLCKPLPYHLATSPGAKGYRISRPAGNAPRTGERLSRVRSVPQETPRPLER